MATTRNGTSLRLPRTKAVITALRVRGFKSLAEDTQIDISPLTILAGANSSGKSSAMQPLLLLKQTLDQSYDPGPLQLDGPHVRFSKSEQLFSRGGNRDGAANMAFGIVLGTGRSVENEYAAIQRKPGLKLSTTRYVHGHDDYRLSEDMDDAGLRQLLPDGIPPRVLTSNGGRADLILSVGRRFAFQVLLASEREIPRFMFPFQFPTLDPFIEAIGSVIHLPGLRGNPERTYTTTAVGQRVAGPFHPYIASILQSWKESDKSLLDGIGDDLRGLDLTWKVDTTTVDDTRVEIKVGRLPRSARGGAHDLVSIADVGLGVSQTLPVLVALRFAKPGQLVYIEQPEIHLHPRAQLELAKILAAAAQRGVIVVVETHSSSLLLGIQTLVASEKLNPDLVKLHWFKRDSERGCTQVASANLDSAGAFGEWPEDFADTTLHAEQSYLEAAEARLFSRA